MKNKTMKPCPFCGRKDSPYAYDDMGRDGISARAGCYSCGAEIVVGHELPRNGVTEKEVATKLKAEAIELWNRRAPLPANVAEAVGRLGPKLRIHSELGEPIYLGLSKPEVADLSTILKHLTEPTHENE